MPTSPHGRWCVRVLLDCKREKGGINSSIFCKRVSHPFSHTRSSPVHRPCQLPVIYLMLQFYNPFHLKIRLCLKLCIHWEANLSCLTVQLHCHSGRSTEPWSTLRIQGSESSSQREMEMPMAKGSALKIVGNCWCGTFISFYAAFDTSTTFIKKMNGREDIKVISSCPWGTDCQKDWCSK